MQSEEIVNPETISFRQTPEEKMEAYTRMSEDSKKIAQVLDQHLNEDIVYLSNNDVLIRLRLGNKIIAEYPIHCEIENDHVIIYEYAGPESNQHREE